MIMVYLIPSNSLLVQYISFTLLVMMYSVPIPMSYLLNEKRVKDVIIQVGWIAATKSIFDSTEKIRKLETDRFLYLKVEEHDKEKTIPKVLKLKLKETTLCLDGNTIHTGISGLQSTIPDRSPQQVHYNIILLLFLCINNI